MAKRYVSERELSEYSGIGVPHATGLEDEKPRSAMAQFCGAVRYI